MAGNAPFLERAAALLDEAGNAASEWRERWQATSGAGYSDADEALLETDALVDTLESAEERWRALEPPAESVEAYTQVTNTLGDLIARLRELLSALEARDFEQLRVVAQAAELSAERLAELRASVRADARSR